MLIALHPLMALLTELSLYWVPWPAISVKTVATVKASSPVRSTSRPMADNTSSYPST